ncbi:MAG: gamma-glutamyltransferase family protein [Acholeplasmataceae bacterium]|nr:MAG: gamma-glutamyltransferase family protein [Acholeplasmataceae bacterium]
MNRHRFDAVDNQKSRRHAKRGMVATSEPQAAEAGLLTLQRGGNAIDAAVAMAAALTVVEPTSNGIGGDLFAIVCHREQLMGLNSSGPAPKAITLEGLKNKGLGTMPAYGFDPVTVPGAVAGWAALSERFGRLPFEAVLRPAIDLAKKGFLVSPVVATYWRRALKIYQQQLKGECFQHWFETFAPNGESPEAGTLTRLPDHARTLQAIADSQGASFYRGSLATQIDAFSRQYDGWIRVADLKAFNPSWVIPIQTTYRGHEVYEIPPNGQGIVALMALNIIEHFNHDIDQTVNHHRAIEAIKLAFADGHAHVADPGHMTVSVDALLDKAYARSRAALITNQAMVPSPGIFKDHGTVYLATADEDGNMVSLIQSNYMGFGSGLVVPGTGIALHNRGHNFALDPHSPNVLGPGKRPYHTIIPGFLAKNGIPMGPFGIMGGFMQPQAHLQVLSGMIDQGLDPQSALDQPRWQWLDGKRVIVEPDFPTDQIQALKASGHDIIIHEDSGMFGRGQIIFRDEQRGGYYGATEKRADGTLAIW